MYTEEEIKKQLAKVNKQGVTVEIKIIQASPNDIVKTFIRESKLFDLLVPDHNHMNFFEAHVIDSTEEKVINQIATHTLVVPVTDNADA